MTLDVGRGDDDLDRIPIPDGTPFVKVTRTINRPIQQTFDYIITVDLTHIFPPIGNVPGVASTSISKEWGKPGLERVNMSTDGSSTREKMLTVDPPRATARPASNGSTS